MTNYTRLLWIRLILKKCPKDKLIQLKIILSVLHIVQYLAVRKRTIAKLYAWKDIWKAHIFRLFQKIRLGNLAYIAMIQSVFRILIKCLKTLPYPSTILVEKLMNNPVGIFTLDMSVTLHLRQMFPCLFNRSNTSS